MLLVDALFINYGGALGLLKYLVKNLKNRGVDFFLLADLRCEGSFDDLAQVEYLEASIKKRKEFYHNHASGYTSVLCFGNVPPPIKLHVPVYTYFHNINLLTLKVKSIKRKFFNFIKREYIRLKRGNTAYWIVQTTNVFNAMNHYLGVGKDAISIIPFYSIPSMIEKDYERKDHEYVFVGEYTDEKGHIPLLRAWKILYQKGFRLKLHLTFSSGPHEFVSLFNQLKKEGVLIENHGFISHNEAFKLLLSCKTAIYPSFDESLGLGLIEAIVAGCDVIVSDLPFAHSVCIPSGTFNPFEPESIADAVIKYENGSAKRTQLLIKDSIDDLINTIVV